MTASSSITHDALLARARRFVPPLSAELHKGQAGRIGIVGGSADYSGAPFFASMASLRAGADLAHVFCTPDAGQVIKSYSPDLIVHTVFRPPSSSSSSSKEDDGLPSEAELEKQFGRLHALVIGPGLGRDDFMQTAGKRALKVARKLGLWVVLDADGLYAVTQDPSIVEGYERAVLTPNVMEFRYLCEKKGINPKSTNARELCPALAKALGHVTVVQKGATDLISNGRPLTFSLPGSGDEKEQTTLECKEEGGLKRCGGQGDVLSGTTGLMLAWAGLWSEGTYDGVTPTPPSPNEDRASLPLLSSYVACTGTRAASRAAFGKHKRGMQTTEVLAEVGPAFESVLDGPAA